MRFLVLLAVLLSGCQSSSRVDCVAGYRAPAFAPQNGEIVAQASFSLVR